MRFWTYGIWYVGAAVWLLVAALSLRLHSAVRTLGDMGVALLFLLAGMFFSRQGRRPGR